MINKRFMFQRILGAVLIALSIGLIMMTAQSVLMEDKDITWAFLTIPLGIYALFSRRCFFLLGGF